MNPFKFRSPALAPLVYPSLTWKIPGQEPIVYLTFDDGPTPGVTDKVLELLQAFDAKATFFCIGKNVEQHPELYHKILQQGHATGNHTQDHLNGWKTPVEKYISNTIQAQKFIHSGLFRPPYGKMTPAQIKKLRKDFRIIMWSALSRDFDANVDANESLRALKSASQPGSILVFHDSKKAAPQLFQILPEYLAFLREEGFLMKSIIG